MTTLLEFFNIIYKPLRLRSRSENTVRLYHHTIRAFSRHLRRDALMSDLNDLTVSAYLASMSERGLSPYTVAKERSQLIAIWNFAARKKVIDHFPDVAQEKLPEIAPMAWIDDQAKKILEVCAKQEGYIDCVPAAKWWSTLHLVMWDTAERIGAIRSAEWSWLEGNWLIIRAQARKGKTRDRAYELHDATIAALNEIRSNRQFIFPWPYTYTYLWKCYGKLLKQAKLPNDRRSKFHRMRRTVASYFEASGGDATVLLDHTKRATTVAYIDKRIVKEQQPAKVLFRLT